MLFKNQRWQNNPFSSKSKQKSGHLVQFLSGEFDSAWVGKHFYHDTMPAAAALPGTGNRRPGIFFFFFFFFPAEY